MSKPKADKTETNGTMKPSHFNLEQRHHDFLHKRRFHTGKSFGVSIREGLDLLIEKDAKEAKKGKK